MDSGAIYRAFALAASKRDIQIDNTEQLLELASNLDLSLRQILQIMLLGVYLDNQEVSSELRTEKTAELASKFAMIGPLESHYLKGSKTSENYLDSLLMGGIWGLLSSKMRLIKFF